jgi:hypothetical protein
MRARALRARALGWADVLPEAAVEADGAAALAAGAAGAVHAHALLADAGGALAVFA